MLGRVDRCTAGPGELHLESRDLGAAKLTGRDLKDPGTGKIEWKNTAGPRGWGLNEGPRGLRRSLGAPGWARSAEHG